MEQDQPIITNQTVASGKSSFIDPSSQCWALVCWYCLAKGKYYVRFSGRRPVQLGYMVSRSGLYGGHLHYMFTRAIWALGSHWEASHWLQVVVSGG